MKMSTRVSALLSLVIAFAACTARAEDPEFSQAELEQMLAPIALYPDTVLSHILIAATYPLEVVQAERWHKVNRDLDGQAAVAAVENKDWDPSVKALVAFPRIITRMSDDLEWTQRLGEAFLLDEAEVIASIQTLRERAYASGNLDSLEHFQVQRESQTIIIEPAVQQVVYVPYYDTRVVYGDWRWHNHPPVYWDYPVHYHSSGGFYWGSGIRVSSGFFFSSFHWTRHQVVVVHIHDHRQRPHFYSGRQVAYYDGARHWQHNPVHRRGASYSHVRLNRDYGRGHRRDPGNATIKPPAFSSEWPSHQPRNPVVERSLPRGRSTGTATNDGRAANTRRARHSDPMVAPQQPRQKIPQRDLQRPGQPPKRTEFLQREQRGGIQKSPSSRSSSQRSIRTHPNSRSGGHGSSSLKIKRFER